MGTIHSKFYLVKFKFILKGELLEKTIWGKEIFLENKNHSNRYWFKKRAGIDLGTLFFFKGNML